MFCHVCWQTNCLVTPSLMLIHVLPINGNKSEEKTKYTIKNRKIEKVSWEGMTREILSFILLNHISCVFLAFFGGMLDVCSVIVWLLAFAAFTVVLLAGGQIPVQQYVASVHVARRTRQVPILCLRWTQSFLGVASCSSRVVFLLVPLPPSAFLV